MFTKTKLHKREVHKLEEKIHGSDWQKFCLGKKTTQK